MLIFFLLKVNKRSAHHSSLALHRSHGSVVDTVPTCILNIKYIQNLDFVTGRLRRLKESLHVVAIEVVVTSAIARGCVDFSNWYTGLLLCECWVALVTSSITKAVKSKELRQLFCISNSVAAAAAH